MHIILHVNITCIPREHYIRLPGGTACDVNITCISCEYHMVCMGYSHAYHINITCYDNNLPGVVGDTVPRGTSPVGVTAVNPTV